MAEWVDSSDLNKLISPGHCIYVGGSTNEPHGLLDSLDAIDDLHFIQQPIAAVNQRDLSDIGKGSTQTTFFMTPFLGEGLKQGRVKFIPMHMRAIYDYIANQPIDVALLLAARDINGNLRFGANVDYVGAAISAARIKIIEVSDEFIAPRGSLLVGDSADYLFASHTPAATYPIAAIDPVSETIGKLVADLIQDGDCIQTGIGAVPAAILNGLGDKNDLGFHSGLLDDGAMRLINAGNITGKYKAADQYKHITGMAVGSDELLEWLRYEKSVSFRSADYTHEVGVIRQFDNFVSVNSAVEVDLFGQVNAEVVNGKQISGTGGSVDFMRAAKACQGGRSIVALSATASRGTVSRIVPKVEMVTALRTDVDIVVTEFGVARLKNASLAERLELLVQIAHPDFRDELRALSMADRSV
jgi:4-hydroxybutyrate CoA-transferase